MSDQFVLTDEINLIQGDISEYEIPHEILIAGKSDQELARYLNEITDSIQLTSESVTEPIIFDKIRSFLKYFKEVKPTILSRLLDIILSAYRHEIVSLEEDLQQNEKDTFQYHKTTIEVYSFLIHWFLTLAEDNTVVKTKKKSKIVNPHGNDFDWTSQKIKAFTLANRLFDSKLSKIWTLSAERMAFTALYTKPAYRLLENPNQAKSRPIKECIFKTLGLCIKHYEHSFVAQNTIIQHLQYWEHSADPMVELLVYMVEKENYTQLADEVLREISNIEFKDTTSKDMKDSPNPKTFATFLQRLADASPKIVLKNLAMLINQLDCESYVIRSAIVDILGTMIVELAKTSPENPSNIDQASDYFDIFEHRMLDTTAYVRQKVLQVYARLFDMNFKFPHRRQTAAKLAIRHLMDKSNMVRKYAIRLLCALMSTHLYSAYGGELNFTEWSNKYTTLKNKVQNVTTAERQEQEEEPTTPVPAEPAVEKHIVTEEQYQAMQMMLTFHEEAIKFIQEIHKAIPVIVQLLSSKSKAEILESINFLVTAYRYKVIHASDGIKKMFQLIWINDANDEGNNVKSVVLSSYQKIYLDFDQRLSKRDNIARITRELVESTYGISVAELTSLEEILSTLMDEKKIDNAIVSKLWHIYSLPNGKVTVNQRKGAIMILGMFAKSNTSIVSDKIDIMLSVGLGPLGKKNLELAKYTCVALERLEGTRPKARKGSIYEGIRYPVKHKIFKAFKNMMDITTNAPEWYGLASQIIKTIFLICQHPEAITESIIRPRSKKLFDTPFEEPTMTQDMPSEISIPEYDRSRGPEELPYPHRAFYGSTTELSQLFFIVGHVAIKLISHLEVIESIWKRKKTQKDSEHVKPDAEDELDQVAGAAEDLIGEAITLVREDEILYGSDSLLAVFGPMLTEVCSRNKVYTDPTLQVNATLALSKFMCVSSKYCERHLQLFFTILEKSKDPKIRGNLVIALGDLAVSFNTLIDDNIIFLYNRLSDPDVTVRKNAVMVLTHLILNGMVKVRGQISEMAKCTEDPDQRVSELAKSFFTELASKQNAIYNNLPDIISNLTSSEPPRLEEEAYRRIMSFIFSFDFTDKEKQSENIIDKLCQRFVNAVDERNWRDIAYCLTLLPFKSERSFKKLLDNWSTYHDKVYENSVHKSFLDIIRNARSYKTQNSQLKVLIDEFENKLAKQRGPEIVETASKKVEKNKKKRKRRTIEEEEEESEEEEFEGDDDDDDDDDEESEDEEEDEE